MAKNALHQAILTNVVRPEMSRLTRDVEGIVYKVHYEEQKIDVEWRDWSMNTMVISRKLPIPQEANGVHSEALKIGDRVRISFKDSNIDHPYVSMIYRHAKIRDYYSKKGSGIPKGMGYI